MFFERDSLSFRILDVLALDQTDVDMLNSGRSFDSISFRIASDAVLTGGGARIQTAAHSVCFVPARLDYRRQASHDCLIAVHLEIEDIDVTEIECFCAADGAEMEALFRELLRVWTSRCVGYRYTCASLLNTILASAHRQNYRGEQLPASIASSVRYLHAHLCDPALSVGALAATSYVSEAYFRRQFKAHYGLSPAKYIIRMRMRHAAGLIATGYYTLAEVAEKSGYTDYPYFSAEFKRIMGMSPSQYQQKRDRREG